jgi:tetraprenyl-beta-curcumene synthase
MLATLRILIELAKYEAVFVPKARREIRRWTDAAAAIPDPALRRTATGAIAVDASNAEAAAAFAVMAPPTRTCAAIELLVAYQVLLDYVDALGERIRADPLLRGFAIGTALSAALARPRSAISLDPLGDDGGYLVALVAACRARLWQLPAAAAIEQQAVAAARRCAQALAHTHSAARSGSEDRLRRWTSAQPATAGYSWWEIAAGGNSDLAVLALLAAAADPATTPDDAAAVAAAYWPHVCVLSTLLDSLVDYERDATTGNFSFVALYPDRAAMRDGLVQSTARSRVATGRLRHPHAHAMIVCGVASYYAVAATPGSLAAQLAPSVIGTLGPTATPIALALRARHRVGAFSRAQPGSDVPTTSAVQSHLGAATFSRGPRQRGSRR